MTNQANRTESLKIKYLKLVNHTISGRSEWSYSGVKRHEVFLLHWALNESRKYDLTKVEREKALKRKRNDAEKLNQGEQILLFQNHLVHGHHFTHLIEVVSHDLLLDNDCPARKVKVVWTPKESWCQNAPLTTKITDFSFRSGNLVQVEAKTVNLNLEYLNQLIINRGQ
jgi:hypothetical protein